MAAADLHMGQKNDELSDTELDSLQEAFNWISNWSPSLRVALIRQVLDTLVQSNPAEELEDRLPQRESFLEHVRRRPHSAQPPNDEQVRQWLDEYRTEKYG